MNGIHRASGMDCKGVLEVRFALRKRTHEGNKLHLPTVSFQHFDDEPLPRVGIARVCALLDVCSSFLAETLHSSVDGLSVRTHIVGVLDIPKPVRRASQL